MNSLSSSSRRIGFVALLVAGTMLSVVAKAAESPDEPAVDKVADTTSAKPKNTAPETLIVHGHKSSTVASTATKSDRSIVETAQSVTVITRNEMDIRGVLSLNQAVRYAAGITQDQRGSTATRYDMFALRGFNVPTYLDGLRLQSSPTGYATAQTDTSRLDRIEILKGPASALYGQSSPGGLVALSSKLPTEQRNYGGITATGGSFDLYRVDADLGGYVNDTGSVRYRLYGTANGSHSQLTRTGSQRFSISPVVTIGADGPTTLTLLANAQWDPKNASYGSSPLKGTLVRAPFGYISRSFYDGDTNFEQFDRTQSALTYIFTQKLGGDWALTSRGRYDNIRTLYKSVYGTGVFANPETSLPDPAQEALGNFNRGTAYARERTQNAAFDTQLHGHVHTGIMLHSIMAGLDYQQSTAIETAGFGSAPDINVLQPVYGQTIQTPATTDYWTKQKQLGLYGQDEINIGRFILTGSLRNDWYTSTQYAGGARTHENPSQITYRVSGLYHFKFGLAPYINYQTSFLPQSGLVSNDNGKTLRQADPNIGKQLEGGAKYQVPGTPILLTAAGFHIEQTKVLVPVGFLGFNTESGKVHSDGFEFEAHIDSWHGWMVEAAYSTQRVHDDSTGKPLIQSGRGNASLFAFYTLPKGTSLAGLGIGGGLRHAASAYGGTASFGDVTVPAYTVFDGSARYDLGRFSHSLKGWTLSASVRNLFNKRYVASCYGYAPYDEWCWYGERRNAQGSLGFTW